MLLQLLLKCHCVAKEKPNCLWVTELLTPFCLWNPGMLPKVTHIKWSWCSSLCSCWNFFSFAELKLRMCECMPDKLIAETWMKGALHPYINLAPEFFYIHLSKSGLQGKAGVFSSLKACGGCCGVWSVTERKPEVQFVSNSQDLDTPGHREKILRAGEFSWGLIHSLLCLGVVGAGENLDLVSEL